jgi:hypothetical protein
MNWLLPHPLPPVSKLHRRHTGRLRKSDNLVTGEGEGGERGAKSYDSKEAWSSLHQSILSILSGVIQVDEEIRKAFQMWSTVTPLRFHRSQYSQGPVHIEIR